MRLCAPLLMLLPYCLSIVILFITHSNISDSQAINQHYQATIGVSEVEYTDAGIDGASRNIPAMLLQKMEVQFGKAHMARAMSNGMFADGLMQILQSIAHKQISAKLDNDIGSTNIRLMMLWKELITLSETQFNRIKASIAQNEIDEGRIAEAVAARKEAQRNEVISVVNNFLVTHNSDVQQNALLSEFSEMFPDGITDHHESQAMHMQLESDQDLNALMKEGEDADGNGHSVEKYEIGQHIILDEWVALADDNHCAFIAEQSEQSFFIASDSNCVVHTHSHRVSDYIQHSMRWDLQLLHAGNVYSSAAGKRVLLTTSTPSVCDNVEPYGMATFTVLDIDDSEHRLTVDIHLHHLYASVTNHKLVHIEVVPIAANDDNGDEQETNNVLQLLQQTDLRSIIVDFNAGKISVGFPDETGRQIIHAVAQIWISADAVRNGITNYMSHLEMVSTVGAGAVLLRGHSFSHFRVDSLSTVNVILSSAEWHSHIAGVDLLFHNELDRFRTSAIFFSRLNELYSYFVQYKNDEEVYFATTKWITPGFTSTAYKWKFVVFSLAKRTPIALKIGFELFDFSGVAVGSDHAGNTDKLMIDLRTNQRYINDDEIDIDGAAALDPSQHSIGIIVPNDLTTPITDVLTDASILADYFDQHSVHYNDNGTFLDVIQIELVLDISDRTRGKISLNGQWQKALEHDDKDNEISLFDLNLDCVNYAFRPILTGIDSGVGAVFIPYENDAEEDNNQNYGISSIFELLRYWSFSTNNNHSIWFDWPIDVHADAFSMGLNLPMNRAIMDSSQSHVFDTLFIGPYSIDELIQEQAHTHHFEYNLAKNVRLRFHSNMHWQNKKCLAGFANSAGDDFFPRTALFGNVNEIPASVQQFDVTLVWEHIHMDASNFNPPSQLILEYDEQSYDIYIDVDNNGSPFHAWTSPNAFKLAFVCEHGTQAAHNLFTVLQRTVIFA